MRRRISLIVILLVSIVAFLCVYVWSRDLFWAVITFVIPIVASIFKETLMPFLRDIAIHIAGAKLEKKTPNSFEELRNSKLNFLDSRERREIKAHLDAQVQMISNMPFVFKDLTEIEDLLANVVEPEAPPINLTNFLPKNPPQEFYEVIRDNNKMVMLGVAGVGKSTFQRHGVLKVIKDAKNARFLRPDEDVIPFYVQLRYVNTATPFPILRYLLEKTPYLAGRKGIARLITLARENRLFLFLDGYDEVPVVLSQKENHLRDELKILLSPVPTRIVLRNPMPELELYREFYKHVQQRCRVWLSSRKDFFRQQSPFEPHELKRGLAGLEIRGVNNRRKLIENVFSRYKTIRVHQDLFKAGPGLLLNLIERDIGELKALSDTPLLLIIICYVYAHEVIRTGNPRVKIANTLDTVIQQYLDLLLEKLDARKDSVDLSISDRAWQMETRSLWTHEKQEFLRYFAAHLYIENKYLENKGAFTLEYIYAKAREFFEAISKSPERTAILQSISRPPGTKGFIDQIKESGIFSVTDTQGDARTNATLYDFPHQRFRELLAAQYFDSGSLNYLIANIKISALNGLLYVFFRITKRKDDIARAILNDMVEKANETDTYLRVFMNCLEYAPEYEPNNVFEKFFVDLLRENIPFQIPHELRPKLESGTYFQPSKDFTARVSSVFIESANETLNAAGLSGELLLIYHKDLLRYQLESYFNTFNTPIESDVFELRATTFLRLDREVAENSLAKAFDRHLHQGNTPCLVLCAEFLERNKPKLLESLFVKAVTDGFQGINFRQSEEQTIREFLLLQKLNLKLFKISFRAQILSCISKNHGFQLSPRLLGVCISPPVAEGDLIAAINNAIQENKPFSIGLAAEIGFFYFGEDFDPLLGDLLLPILHEPSPAIERAMLISKQLNSRLKRLCPSDDPVHDLFYLVEIADRLLPTTLENFPDPTVDSFCYIITEQILKELQRYSREQGQSINRRRWRKMSNLMYTALSQDQISNLLPRPLPDPMLDAILGCSRVRASNYKRVWAHAQADMEVTEALDDRLSAARKRNRQGFIRERIS
jgi:hypothetical protein